MAALSSKLLVVLVLVLGMSIGTLGAGQQYVKFQEYYQNGNCTSEYQYGYGTYLPASTAGTCVPYASGTGLGSVKAYTNGTLSGYTDAVCAVPHIVGTVAAGTCVPYASGSEGAKATPVSTLPPGAQIQFYANSIANTEMTCSAAQPYYEVYQTSGCVVYSGYPGNSALYLKFTSSGSRYSAYEYDSAAACAAGNRTLSTGNYSVSTTCSSTNLWWAQSGTAGTTPYPYSTKLVSTPTPAPTPAKTVTKTPHSVKSTVTLAGISVAQFDTKAQNGFKSAVAKLAGKHCGKASALVQCTLKNVELGAIADTRRRDLSVTYTIYVASAAAAATATATLKAVSPADFTAAVNKGFKDYGSSVTTTGVTVVSAPVAGTNSPSSSSSSASLSSGAIAGIVIACIVAVVVVGIVVFFVTRKAPANQQMHQTRDNSAVTGTEKRQSEMEMGGDYPPQMGGANHHRDGDQATAGQI